MTNLSALSPHDFEILLQDLLGAFTSAPLESFTAGRDGGIDLRYLGSGDETNPEIIVQCKHYEKSGFSKLKSKLKEELPQAKSLAASRYIIATSVSMTPNRKSQLVAELDGLIASQSDIVGKEDIGRILRTYPEVERNHFKLWLNSTAVLETIIHNEVLSQTKSYMDELQEKMKVFVHNDSVGAAQQRLEQLHTCIIAGPPGVGKTTLADILLVALVTEGYDPVIITEDVKEAFKRFREGSRQVFFYDDFLGRTTSNEKLGKNEDDRILRLIRTVQKDPSKRFILTTRSYILENAKSQYPRLDEGGIDVSKFILDMQSYTQLHRAHILYNHLYFSTLSANHLAKFVESGAYRELVRHKNYNPRLVQQAVEHATRENIEPVHFSDYLIKTFDNPKNFWRRIVLDEMSLPQRVTLAYIALSSSGAELSKFEDFYSSLRNNTKADIPTQNDLLKSVEGTAVTLVDRYTGVHIDLVNPGLQDAVIDYVLPIPLVLRTLAQGELDIEQLVRLWNHANSAKQSGQSDTFPWRHLSFQRKMTQRESGSNTARPDLQRSVDGTIVELVRATFVSLFRESGNSSAEERVLQALKMMHFTNQSDPAHELADLLRKALISRWRSNTGDRLAACRLISYCIKIGMTDENFSAVGFGFIVSDGHDTPDDFRALLELSEFFDGRDDIPQGHSRPTNQDVRNSIESYLPAAYDDLSTIESRDELDEEIGAWGFLLEDSEVGDSSYFDDLYTQQNSSLSEVDEPDWMESASASSRDGDMAEIDHLFSSLGD